MILIIVRHGEAEPKSGSVPDENRKLTEMGARNLRNNLNLVRNIEEARVDIILSSPLLRGRMSAEIAREVFELSKIDTDISLEPASSPYDVFGKLSKFEHSAHVLIVTHQPLVSHLIAGLLDWSEERFSFGTGAVALVQVKDITAAPRGVLLGLLPGS